MVVTVKLFLSLCWLYTTRNLWRQPCLVLATAVEYLLGPLKRFGFQFMKIEYLSMKLQFVPTLIDGTWFELWTLKECSVDFGENIIKRLRLWFILIPLSLRLRTSGFSATAMEARGYQVNGRSQYQLGEWMNKDSVYTHLLLLCWVWFYFCWSPKVKYK